MALFAKVKYPIYFIDRITLAGDSTLLIPVVSVDDSIQWHYLRGNDRFEQAKQHAKVVDSKLQTFDFQALTKLRAFLGFCTTSEVVLGTRTFSKTRILESSVPRTGPKLTFKLEGPITAGVNAKGHAVLNLGSTWKLRGRESSQIESEQLTLDDRLQQAKLAPALLYDNQTCRAFLTSELSAILHMVSAYLEANSQLEDKSIPYAEPSPDGGEAAYKAIVKAKDIDVPFGVGESRKYSAIIDDFLRIFEQRKMQTRARRQEVEVSLKVGLRGWDFADLQEKTVEFFERELPTSLLSRRPVWWKLFKKSSIIILFGENIRHPICKSAENHGKFCNAWAEIPADKNMLLASITSLMRLKRSRCKHPNKYTGYYMISDKLAWARPIHSQLFDPCVEGGSCNPVQTMFKVGRLRYWPKDIFLQRPGPIQDKGALLFGDVPSDFASRPCHLVASIPPRHYSIPFLAAISTVLFVLTYSISRWFPTVGESGLEVWK
ncbi:hypothetical protein F5884DRAFT_474314 [Xylogone sp. PMI_703]|nr:hypothetical protein F5884DRAFT_474314 [Xylogone sp. PMI_703]